MTTNALAEQVARRMGEVDRGRDDLMKKISEGIDTVAKNQDSQRVMIQKFSDVHQRIKDLETSICEGEPCDLLPNLLHEVCICETL